MNTSPPPDYEGAIKVLEWVARNYQYRAKIYSNQPSAECKNLGNHENSKSEACRAAVRALIPYLPKTGTRLNTRNLNMKTHTELLTELINAVYALPLDAKLKQIHDLQMLAAEIKGQMMAHPLFTMDTLKIDGLTDEDCVMPDSDGWIENTGVDPNCRISKLKFHDGEVSRINDANSNQFIWRITDNIDAITHYKPA